MPIYTSSIKSGGVFRHNAGIASSIGSNFVIDAIHSDHDKWVSRSAHAFSLGNTGEAVPTGTNAYVLQLARGSVKLNAGNEILPGSIVSVEFWMTAPGLVNLGTPSANWGAGLGFTSSNAESPDDNEGLVLEFADNTDFNSPSTQATKWKRSTTNLNEGSFSDLAGDGVINSGEFPEFAYDGSSFSNNQLNAYKITFTVPDSGAGYYRIRGTASGNLDHKYIYQLKVSIEHGDGTGLNSNDDIVLHIDKNSATSPDNSKVIVKAGSAGTEVASIDESGNLQIEGDINNLQIDNGRIIAKATSAVNTPTHQIQLHQNNTDYARLSFTNSTSTAGNLGDYSHEWTIAGRPQAQGSNSAAQLNVFYADRDGDGNGGDIVKIHGDRRVEILGEERIIGNLRVDRGMTRNAAVVISEVTPGGQGHHPTSNNSNKFCRILRTGEVGVHARQAAGLYNIRVLGNPGNSGNTESFGFVLEASFRPKSIAPFYYSAGTRLHIISTSGQMNYFNPAEDLFMTWENNDSGGFAEIWMKAALDYTYVAVTDLGSSGGYSWTSVGFQPVHQESNLAGWVGNTWRDEEEALTGAIDPTASTTVTGVGTAFTTELKVEDHIRVNDEVRTVTAIASDTELTVSQAFTDTANDTTPQKVCYAGVVKDGSNNDVKRQVFAEYRSAGSKFHLGTYGDNSNNFASLCHYAFHLPGLDEAEENAGVRKNYALLHKVDGSTFLNSSTGKYIYFRTNNEDGVKQMHFKDGVLTVGTKVVCGDFEGNADTATSAATLTTARTIGGVSFDGSANISLPGVNTEGDQDTTGVAFGGSGSTYVANNNNNVYYPLTFSPDTTPDNNLEVLQANAGITANPYLGIIQSRGSQHIQSNFQDTYGDLSGFSSRVESSNPHVGVGSWDPAMRSGFSVGCSGFQVNTALGGNLFVAPGYDLNQFFKDHEGNRYLGYSASRLVLWVRFFATPIDRTSSAHAISISGEGVNLGVSSQYEEVEGLPVAEWTDTSSYLSVNDHSDFNFADSQSFSISLWIYHPVNWTLTSQQWIVKGSGNGKQEWQFFYYESYAGGSVWFGRKDESTDAYEYRYLGNLKAGQANDASSAGWRHWCWTDGTITGNSANDDMRCYLNGVVKTTGSYTSGDYVSTENLAGDLIIGGGDGRLGADDIGLVGVKFAELAIWTYELSAEDIKAIYNASNFYFDQINKSLFSINDGSIYAKAAYSDDTTSKPNFYINSSGKIQRTTHANSERILKTNIEDLKVDLNSLCDLVPSLFNWKQNPNGKKIPGFIIDQVEDKFPELVEDTQAEGQYRSLHYDRFCAYIISAMKEIKERLEVIESKLD